MATPRESGHASSPAGAGALDRRQLLLGGLAGLALPGVARAGSAEREDAMALWTLGVVLVRHAEKQAGEDPELTQAGQAAARWMADVLAAAPVTHLEHSATRRTAQTVAPLAEACGVEPSVTDPRDVDGLRERLHALEHGKVAVVAGHSNTLPAAIVALGGSIDDLDPKGHIHEDVYERLFVVTLARWADGRLAASTLELRIPLAG